MRTPSQDARPKTTQSPTRQLSPRQRLAVLLLTLPGLIAITLGVAVLAWALSTSFLRLFALDAPSAVLAIVGANALLLVVFVISLTLALAGLAYWAFKGKRPFLRER